MTDFPRLIERAFPLKQASLDSVYEKNVRHGHISTLHIWPAWRPLAACRGAWIIPWLSKPVTPAPQMVLVQDPFENLLVRPFTKTQVVETVREVGCVRITHSQVIEVGEV
ncbi:MAG: DUF1156 domain-containing protein [Candidatus Nanopelagicales bacterium]